MRWPSLQRGGSATAGSTSPTCAPKATSFRRSSTRRSRSADAPALAVEIYHLKATGRKNWHKMPSVDRARIDAARAEGLDVTTDMYPYVASGTGLSSLPAALGRGRRQVLRQPARSGDARQDPRGDARTPAATGRRRWPAPGREGVMPVGFEQDAQQAVRRQAAHRDRRDAQPALGRHRDRPAGRRGAAHLHHLLHDERRERASCSCSNPGSRSPPTPAGSIRPGPSGTGRPTHAPTAPIRACSASTCARRR